MLPPCHATRLSYCHSVILRDSVDVILLYDNNLFLEAGYVRIGDWPPPMPDLWSPMYVNIAPIPPTYTYIHNKQDRLSLVFTSSELKMKTHQGGRGRRKKKSLYWVRQCRTWTASKYGVMFEPSQFSLTTWVFRVAPIRIGTTLKSPTHLFATTQVPAF